MVFMAMKRYIDASDFTTFGACEVFVYIFSFQVISLFFITIFDSYNCNKCIITSIILIIFAFVVNTASHMICSGKLKNIHEGDQVYFS